MTDDELLAIRDRNDDRCRWGLYGATTASGDCARLLDEVARLGDENAAMRPLVVALAQMNLSLGGRYLYLADDQYFADSYLDGAEKLREQARELVAQWAKEEGGEHAD